MLYASFFLNICNMRSVTRKPPTTLIVAQTTEISPKITEKLGSTSLPATIKAPITDIPEIALEPDISGVCNVGGTLLITSNPAKEASTKTNRALINDSFMVNFVGVNFVGFVCRRCNWMWTKKQIFCGAASTKNLILLNTYR